jgi:hypothetical protein
VFGGLAVGFAASRVLRASSSERYQRSGAVDRGETMGLPRPNPYDPPGYEPPTYEPPVASTPTPAGERLR